MLAPGIHVLCYHGVVDRIVDPVLERNFMPVDRFREQIQYFRQYSIISLEQLENALSKPEMNEPLIVITVDDGHVSALQIHEILTDFQAPWAAFIATGVVGRNHLFWTAELALLILHGSCKKVDLLGQQWSLESRLSRVETYHHMRRSLKRMPGVEKDEWLARLREQYLPDEPLSLLERYPVFQVMNWDEIRSLHQAGVAIGSHGVNHEIHHGEQDVSVREAELRSSRTEIELQLGTSCRYFAFPNGNYRPESPSELAAAGYCLGFTTDERVINANENPFLLPRVNPRRYSESIPNAIPE